MSDTGYTKLSNDLFDWLLAKSSVLSKRELIVMLVVIRNTVGWNRESSNLSCRFIANATGVAFNHVSEAIKSLEEKGFISVDRSNRTASISVNRNSVTKTGTVPESVTTNQPDSSQIRNTTVPESVTTQFPNQELNSSQIRNKQIQTIQKQNNNNPKLASWLQ